MKWSTIPKRNFYFVIRKTAQQSVLIGAINHTGIQNLLRLDDGTTF